jgi:hypothetical protein
MRTSFDNAYANNYGCEDANPKDTKLTFFYGANLGNNGFHVALNKR